MISAKIVCDSIAPSGVRLTTFVLTYPRFIHSEFMTHRVFSRNASSSRAIPVKKQIELIKTNPAIPLDFRKNQKGMQAGELLEDQEAAIRIWLEGRDRAVEIAEKLANMEVHKQYANRVMEPYAHISVVCTATDFNNFFALRCHEDAQPEIHALADQMYGQYILNKPQELKEGQYHLPFIDTEDFTLDREWMDKVYDGLEPDLQIKRSVARCARVSFLNHEGKKPTIEEDLNLYARLLSKLPIHASPAEHQAAAASDPELRSGNFRGWIQYRKTLKDENVTEFKL